MLDAASSAFAATRRRGRCRAGAGRRSGAQALDPAPQRRLLLACIEVRASSQKRRAQRAGGSPSLLHRLRRCSAARAWLLLRETLQFVPTSPVTPAAGWQLQTTLIAAASAAHDPRLPAVPPDRHCYPPSGVAAAAHAMLLHSQIRSACQVRQDRTRSVETEPSQQVAPLPTCSSTLGKPMV